MMNMTSREEINEVPKYKKKSTSKGLPRSKHKHIYETVLLTTISETQDYKTGLKKKVYRSFPTKVCSICGRIDKVDRESSYYIEEQNGYQFLFSPKLSDKALSLPRWTCNSFDKFAIKEIE